MIFRVLNLINIVEYIDKLYIFLFSSFFLAYLFCKFFDSNPIKYHFVLISYFRMEYKFSVCMYAQLEFILRNQR